MSIKYVVPSYKRPKGQLTLNWLSRARVWVRESDYEEYIKENPKYKDNFHIMPDEYQGHGKSVAMNYILDHEWDSETDAIIMLDDDVIGIYLWRMEEEAEKLTEQDFYEVCENSVLLAREWGCGMFVFNNSMDRLKHNPSAPFRLHKVGAGAMAAFCVNDGLRYDEKFFTGEDIDIQIQSMKKYHKLLLIERYVVDAKQWTNSGGYKDMRDDKESQKGRTMLIKKWGKDVIKIKKGDEDTCCYIVRVPLEGT